MNKFILIFCCISIHINILDLDIPHIEHLVHLSGKVETYYAEGSEIRAKYLQQLIEDAVMFYENKLNDTFNIKLLVLNKKAWKYFSDNPFPLPEYSKNPDRIIMGAPEIYNIKLPQNITLYGKSEIYFWDFIMVHELGHYITSHINAKSHSEWSGEFFADYVQFGFLIEKVPEWHFPHLWSTFFTYLPFKYKSLEDFNYNYSMNHLNYIFYQGKFQELAYKIFKKSGWNFFYEYITIYQNINEKYKDQKNQSLNKEQLLEYSILNLQQLEPEIFNEWLQGMKKTNHSYFVIIILVILIVFVRLSDTSFKIFKNQGLKTKNKYKIFGVPRAKIRSELRSLKDSNIRIKLMRIIVTRIVMYILIFILFLILLIFYFARIW